jgi:hypothetical protein
LKDSWEFPISNPFNSQQNFRSFIEASSSFISFIPYGFLALMSTISVKIEFGGGLELLFSKKRSHRLILPAAVPKNNSTDSITNLITVEPTKPIDITYLIYYLKDHMLKERVELFMEKGTV